jgi:hypothetical protein
MRSLKSVNMKQQNYEFESLFEMQEMAESSGENHL